MILMAWGQNRDVQRAHRTEREVRDPMRLLAVVNPALPLWIALWKDAQRDFVECGL